MAKKNLKRGLALGALMAFVITGSAMAAEYYNGIDTKGSGEDLIIKASNEILVLYKDKEFTGWKDVTITGTWSSPTSSVITADSSLFFRKTLSTASIDIFALSEEMIGIRILLLSAVIKEFIPLNLML